MKRILAILLVAMLALSSVSAFGEASEPITFTLFVDHSWFWFDTWGNEPCSRKITELTGVSFDVTRATDGQQLALMIAGGDLPDIVYTANINIMLDPEICWSYNELVDQYGVDIHATPAAIANNTAADGNYYCLLNSYTSQEAIDAGTTLLSPGTTSLAYRTDIYEAIGSPELNTIEDLENCLIAAKEAFPDIVPLLIDPGYLSYFAGQLGVKGNPGIGYDADNNPVYGLNVDGIKDYYALLNRFAREGLIPDETLTYNFDRFAEIRNSGLSFMQVRSAGEAIEANAAAMNAGTGYTWKLLTHELSDNAIVNPSTGIGWSGTFITKNCKDPQRAIEFMSWCRSDEGRKLCSWGIEGVDWEYNEQGQTVYTDAIHQAFNEGKTKQDDFGIAVWIFGDQGDENAFVDYSATNEHSVDQIERLRSAVAHTKVMSELYFCTPKEGEMLNIFNALENMRASEEMNVIFAESEEAFEAAWENMQNQAEQLGISTLNAWMSEQLDAYNAKLAG